jgi:outer membrane lipoprotein SlyB
MKNHSITAALALAGLLTASLCQAQTQLTPKEQYSIETRRAAARYADDKKLCSEESSSTSRMQCVRDAKSEYDRSLVNAKAALKAPLARQAAVCADCGKVVSVEVSEKAGEGSALGVIAGGLAGALLGNQVGSGHGRQLATVAGAAGGAYAGNKVEQQARTSKIWTVNVRYETGNQASFNFDRDPALMAGDRVRNANGSIARD